MDRIYGPLGPINRRWPQQRKMISFQIIFWYLFLKVCHRVVAPASHLGQRESRDLAGDTEQFQYVASPAKGSVSWFASAPFPSPLCHWPRHS